MICAEYPPHVEGGLGVHYRELARELAKLCRLTLITGRISREAPALERSGDLTVVRVKMPSTFPLNHLVFNWRAWRAARKLPAQVHHLCAPFGLLDLVFRKVPTVVKIHSLYEGQSGTALYNHLVFPLARRMDRYMIENADMVMTTSEFMARSISKRYEPRKLVTIANGLGREWQEAGSDRSAARDAVGAREGEFIILSCGRFVPRKGTLELVRAFHTLSRRRPQARLMLVGKGRHAESAGYGGRVVEYIAANGLSDRVDLVEWQPADRMRKYYQAADIYVHAATYEPFGNVLLEAMATGLPVVAVRAGGPEEVAGGSAVILDSNDPGQLQKAMESFMDDKGMRERYSRMSLERAGMFSWERAARETLQGYRELLAS